MPNQVPATEPTPQQPQPRRERIEWGDRLEDGKVQVPLLVLALGLGLGLLFYLWRYPCPSAEPEETVVTFLHLNDTYEIAPLDEGRTAGMARVATLRKQLQQEPSPLYTVHAGDFLSPSALGNAEVKKNKPLAGEQMVAVLKAVGVDYLTFGNHEFDLTPADFDARLKELTALDSRRPDEFPRDPKCLREIRDAQRALISSNVHAANGQPFPGVPANRLLTIRDPKGDRVLLRIDLFAVTTKRDSPKVPYAQIDEPLLAAQEQLRAWQRLEEKPDVVVALTHQSLSEDEELARKVPGIDLILGGHEHENAHRRTLPDSDLTRPLPPIYRADANVRTVYIHRLTFDLRGRRLRRIHSHLKAINDAIAPDPEVKAVVEKYVRLGDKAFRAAGLNPEEVLGEVTQALDGRESEVRNRSTLLTELIGEAMLDALKDTLPERRLAVYNSGAIRIDELIRPGKLTMYDILRVLPYRGELWAVRLKGESLQRILDARHQGRGTGAFLQTANVLAKGEGPQHIWLIGGHELDPNAEYHLAINDYLLEGGETGLAFPRSIKDSAKGRRIGDWRKVVGDYLKAKKKWPHAS